MLGEVLVVISIDMLLCYMFLDMIATGAYSSVIIMFVFLFGLIFVMNPLLWFANLAVMLAFNYFIILKFKDRYIEMNCKVIK